MKKTALYLLAFFALSTNAYASEKYSIEKFEDKARVRSIAYIPYSQEYRIAEKDADNQLMSPEQKRQYLETVPAGGRLIVYLLDSSVQTAGPKNWLYIITDDEGKELYRSEGKEGGTEYTYIKYVCPARAAADIKIKKMNICKFRLIWRPITTDFVLICCIKSND